MSGLLFLRAEERLAFQWPKDSVISECGNEQRDQASAQVCLGGSSRVVYRELLFLHDSNRFRCGRLDDDSEVSCF